MKISVLITVAFIAFGCGRKISSNNGSTDGENPNLQSVNFKKLKGIDPVYLESINKPYTGKAFRLYPSAEASNKKKQVEFTFRNGVQDGLTVRWHRNGQKWSEENFKDGGVVEGSAKYWNSFGEPVNNLEDSLSVKGIHSAAEEGNIELVKKHLESGTDANGKDNYGRPPLYHAIWNDHIEIAKLLISEGAILNTEQPKIFNALYSAAGGNASKETIELLITNGADLNFIRERGGNKGDETPLDRATRKGRTEIAELLRTHGAKTSKELKAEAE